LFMIFGILVTIPGIGASEAAINKEAGINLGLWVGLIMLIIGLLFLAWVLLKPPAPITTAEAEAARKAREEFERRPQAVTSSPVSLMLDTTCRNLAASP